MVWEHHMFIMYIGISGYNFTSFTSIYLLINQRQIPRTVNLWIIFLYSSQLNKQIENISLKFTVPDKIPKTNKTFIEKSICISFCFNNLFIHLNFYVNIKISLFCKNPNNYFLFGLDWFFTSLFSLCYYCKIQVNFFYKCKRKESKNIFPKRDFK